MSKRYIIYITPLFQSDPEEFGSMLRIDPLTFGYIVDKIGHAIAKNLQTSKTPNGGRMSFDNPILPGH